MKPIEIKLTKAQIKALEPFFKNAEEYRFTEKKCIILIQPFDDGRANVGFIPHPYSKKIYNLVLKANKEEKP